jgi:hypothetical protein
MSELVGDEHVAPRGAGLVLATRKCDVFTDCESPRMEPRRQLGPFAIGMNPHLPEGHGEHAFHPGGCARVDWFAGAKLLHHCQGISRWRRFAADGLGQDRTPRLRARNDRLLGAT